MSDFSVHIVKLGVHLIHTVPVLKKEDLLITFSADLKTIQLLDHTL